MNKKVLLGLFIAILLVEFSYIFFNPDKIDAPIETIVGQSFVVGIQGPNLEGENTRLLETVRPGGVILYRYNIESTEKLKKLITDLQKIAIKTTGIPYLIMIDEEPGGATRLDIFRDIDSGGIANWDSFTKDAQSLSDLGINVDLGPLADYVFDGKSAIKHRLPFKTVAEQNAFNTKFIDLLHSQSVGATLKHFPGVGLIENDTHINIFRSQATEQDLKKSEELFSSGIAAGADFIMTTHAIYNSIEPNISASISPKTINMIRDLGFKGLIITDDITNMPVGDPSQISMNDAAKRTLYAGHNLILCGTKRAPMFKIFDFILSGYKDGDSKLKKQLNTNYKMILEYKHAKLNVV